MSGTKQESGPLPTKDEVAASIDDFNLTSGYIPSGKEPIRIAGPVPFQSWFIIVTELCERFAYYGATLMFIPYIKKELMLPSSAATGINRGFQFFAYLTTIIGAVVADVKLGKFKTILLFSTMYFVGLVLLAISAADFSKESNFNMIGFIIAIYLFIAWGTGGIKSNVSVFAADQVPLGDRPAKDPNYVLDYNMTVERVFRFFYWAVNIGSLLGPLVCPPLVNNTGSYFIGFGVPALIFIAGGIVFISGRYLSKYVENPVKGNPIFKVIRVVRYCISNRNRRQGIEKSHFLDSALDVNNGDWDDTFVVDLKRSLQACKVFIFFSLYWALNFNSSDSFIIMGLTMSRPAWIQPEQLNIVNSLLIIISIPLFDVIVFPTLRKFGFKMGPIIRITIGFFLNTVAFVYMTVLQHYVYSTGPYYDFTGLHPDIKEPVNDITIFWQIPGYVLLAISEVFAATTVLEYSFKYSSPELKSVVSSLYYLAVCFSSIIGIILAIWSYDPNYVPLFAAQTCFMFVATLLFYYLFRGTDDQ